MSAPKTPLNRILPSTQHFIPYQLAMPFCIGMVRLLIAATGGMIVSGKENLIWDGKSIIASNHVSDIDPVFLGVAQYPLGAWWMAKEELFHVPILGEVCATIHAFPVVRGIADRIALRFSEDRLTEDQSLTIFPEGRVNWEPERMRPFHEGVALLALRTGAPVIPAAIVGTNRVWPYAKYFPRFSVKPVRIGFGRPLSFNHLTGSRRQQVDRVLADVRREIEALRQRLLADERV